MIRTMVFCASLLLMADQVRADELKVGDKPRVCMMQDKVMAKAGVPIEVGGKLYYGCCPACSGALKGEPQRYTKAVDPVTGNEVDKATAYLFDYEGDAYYFESESSRAEFARDPGHFTTRIKPEGSKPR